MSNEGECTSIVSNYFGSESRRKEMKQTALTPLDFSCEYSQPVPIVFSVRM